MKKNRIAMFCSTLCLGIVAAMPDAHAADYSNAALKNNPNATPDGSCFRVPARINASRGDIVLSSAPSGVVKSLMAALGQVFTHTGMMTDVAHIRHNTMDTGKIDLVGHIGVLVPDHFNTSGSHSVRDGFPGIITETVNDAYVGKTFHLANGLVMTSGDAGRRSNTATQMEAFKGFYRLFAYTNPVWSNPFVLEGNSGNMCSGTVAIADIAAGNGQTWGTIDYSAEVRNPAAAILYDAVRKKIIDGVDGFKKFITIDSNVRQFANNGANQIVNCMAFNDCGNTGSRWKNGVGTGSTISPDDLLLIGQFWADVAAAAGQPDPFTYTAAIPVQTTGTFLCCNGTCTAKGLN